MGVLDFFKPVPTMAAAEIRKFMASHPADQYNLVDVRQPGEYERGHLPGAQLIPLAELVSRQSEISRGRPTFVY